MNKKSAMIATNRLREIKHLPQSFVINNQTIDISLKADIKKLTQAINRLAFVISRSIDDEV